MDNKGLMGFSRARLIIIVVAVLLVVGAAVSLWVMVFSRPSTDQPVPDQSTTTYRLLIDEEVTKKAIEAEQRGDKEGAIAVYDEELQRTTDEATRSELELRKAVIHSNSDNQSEAIRIAQLAHVANPQSLGPVTLLAMLYEQANQYTKAAEFYRKAAQLTVGSEETDATRDYYLENAARLEAMES